MRCAKWSVDRELSSPNLQHGELVAAHAGDDVGFAHARAQPLGDDLEQLVADRMAERVVHRLEPVEIETQHRERLAEAARAREGMFDPLAKQHTVGQIGECIVMRHVLDARLGAPAL